ncbi:MAG: 4'-phosphopantetheinyl transferase superfamily protein [Desulfobacula sp.]|nr:4'-phosphopantetheinyl transferase superfamily protein [Desulfobacula sp.]
MNRIDMHTDSQNNINIRTISPKPGIFIWYARIPRIMQLIFHKDSLPDSRQMRNITFDKSHFSQSFLNDEEISIINGFKAVKKQIEWISGRYLIKLMIQNIFSKTLPLDEITISYLDEGAPFLTHAPYIPISLSHSNNFTAAGCCMDKTRILGIDIEKIGTKPDKGFLKIAFTKKEISHLADNAAPVFKNWTIKEAYLKYIKKGFNENLHRVEVIDNEIWHNQNRVNVDIYSTMIDDNYILSLVAD